MDYEALKTLESVIRNQNFERAAKELFVTQSAISQRINQLEVEFGQRLLIRELPYRATELGETILSHYRKVLSLEQTLNLNPGKESTERPTIRIAMNVDTLEIWFKKVLQNTEIAKLMNLEITTDDEKYTLNYLKSGRVDLSIGIQKTPVSNHECVPLGAMTYVLVSNQEFKKQNVPRKFKDFDFKTHPAIIFNDRDDLHTEYLKKFYGFTTHYPKSAIPSIACLKASVIAGFGYGLKPLMDIQKELKAKDLVLIDKENSLQRELYLHHWNYQTPALKKLISVIKTASASMS
ncbi:MAG: ArgP/LysG family DNA-binding transcriptional regulator [Bdellovibrionota bacterium]